MNLKRVSDSKKDYVGLSKKFPNNFYACLAEKMVRQFSTAVKESGVSVSSKILGNDIKFKVGSNQISVEVGGKTFKRNSISLPELEKLIYEIYQADLKGEVEINHGISSVIKDRTDFRKMPGTVFTRLFKSVQYDEKGNKNEDVSGARSKAPVLTEQQYKNACQVESFKRNNFKKYTEGDLTLFVNNKTAVIRPKNLQNRDYKDPSVSQMTHILANIPSMLEWYARNECLLPILENIEETYRNTLVLYKGSAWLILPEVGKYKLTRL